MKKTIVIASVVVLAMTVVVWRWLHPSYFDYISRISGIAIPTSSKQLDSYEFDWCVVVKYRLPEKKVEEFRRSHPFVPLANLHEEMPMHLWSLAQFIDKEPPSYRKTEGLLALRGRTKTNKWEFALDLNSATVWVVVMFPDPAGALP